MCILNKNNELFYIGCLLAEAIEHMENAVTTSEKNKRFLSVIKIKNMWTNKALECVIHAQNISCENILK